MRHKPFRRSLGIHLNTPPKAPEAGQRPFRGRRPAGRSGRRFEQVAEFEIERRNAPQAATFDSGQYGINLGSSANRQAIDETFETPCGRRSLRSLPIFEKCVEIQAYLRFR